VELIGMDRSALTAPYLRALQEFYQGEILGEAMFDAMLQSAGNESERYKIGLMLQLETETKARLRPILAAQGLSLQEDPRMRPDGEQLARELANADWNAKMRALAESISQTWLPRYRELTATLPPPLRPIGQSMVEHEQALLDMAQRELAGQSHRSDEPVRRLLAHPLPLPVQKPA
jgi:tryptophan 2,3-dioxygenase